MYRKGNMSAHLLAKWAIFLLWIRPVPISSLSPRIVQALDRDGFRPSTSDCSLILLGQQSIYSGKKNCTDRASVALQHNFNCIPTLRFNSKCTREVLLEPSGVRGRGATIRLYHIFHLFSLSTL